MSTASTLPRIFVQIASYRDKDCQYTVKDLFEKATHPERIFVGICWQYIKEEDADCFEIPYPRPEQVRVYEVDALQSKGVCWARMQTQQLWRGEEFTLGMDAHMRFEQGWDEIVLAMWHECDNEKAVISCYPSGFTPPDDCNRDWVFGMAAKEFDDNGILYLHGKPAFRVGTEEQPSQPISGAFIGACTLFGPSSIITDVPYDPYIYFFGEEISLAVRLWTHGYDIHHPNKLFIYHDWERDKRKASHFSDHHNWSERDLRSKARVRHLLGAETSTDPLVIEDIEKYGLGTERTLAHYEAYSGVDFTNKTLQEFTLAGTFPKLHSSRTSTAHVTAGKHKPKKVFESRQAIIFDDFLPEDLYQKIYAFALKTDYETINTKGKVSRAWLLEDGFPLRSVLNEYYYAEREGVEKPQGSYVYPTNTDLDQFIDALLEIQPEVEHLIGKQDKDWAHVSATCWLYPHGTGLAMHDDGSGVYSGAFAYFLNPTWRVHWGGLNLMIEDEGNKLVHDYRKTQDGLDFHFRQWLHATPLDELLMEHGFARCIFPKRNRIVFIANDAYHMVTRVNEQSGDNIRMSIAGFFSR